VDFEVFSGFDWPIDTVMVGAEAPDGASSLRQAVRESPTMPT
jgi:hypothetical protein